ncbi:MAG TPA: GGDEF domain-containing protein [Acidobacteriaceae bacterium]|nr:GGDEF domain-containing protein [Acidobacteriaceae bacterium]
MYTPFLMCGYAAALLLMLFGFRGVRRSTPDLRGSRQLSWFILCALFSVVLLGVRPWTPALLSIVLSNFLLFTGALFLYLATADILEIDSHLFPWPGGVLIVALPLFVWFTYANDQVVVRLVIHAIVIGSIFLSTAFRLFRSHREPETRQPARACAWLLIFASCLQGAWCLFEFQLSPQQTNFVHPDLINVGFSYLSMVLALATVIGLLWLALTVHRTALHRMAQTDSLTSLLNRRAFEEILRRDLLRTDRSGSVLGIMLIDLDYFKQVNDSLGHFAGDDVLRRIAVVLRDGTRPSDVLARYGGEEFVVLLRNAGVDESLIAAERIRLQISNLSGLPGRVNLTASIGVAVSQPRDTVTELLLRADEALYRSKREGRNLVSVYRISDEEMASAGAVVVPGT